MKENEKTKDKSNMEKKLWFVEVRNTTGYSESEWTFRGTEEEAIEEGISSAKEANSLNDGLKEVVVTMATEDENGVMTGVLDFTAYQGTGEGE